MDEYLRSTYYIEKDHPEVAAFTSAAVGNKADPVEQAVRLYYAVRDGIRYDPYAAVMEDDKYRASYTLRRGRHFCIPKAILLASCARHLEVPARLGFADVRNHLASARLLKLMKTDLFVFHGFTEFYLEDRWIKATPSFNIELCERFGVKPLDFDGRSDAIFHPYDSEGKKHMEYIEDRGHRADFDLAELEQAWREHYPHYFATGLPEGSLEAELDRDSRSGFIVRGH